MKFGKDIIFFYTTLFNVQHFERIDLMHFEAGYTCTLPNQLLFKNQTVKKLKYKITFLIQKSCSIFIIENNFVSLETVKLCSINSNKRTWREIRHDINPQNYIV